VRKLRIIYVAGYCAVLDPLNGFINCKKRYEKPFARDDRLPEAVRYFNMQTGRTKNPMDDVLKFAAIDVV